MKRPAFLLSLVVSVAIGLVMVGCGGEQQLGPPPVIGVAVSPASVTVQMGGTADFSATVTNDSSTEGVTWAVSCSSASCGTVSPTSSKSGATVTYTVPSDPPANDLAVTLTATSVADTTKSSSATITVPSVAISVTASASSVLAGDVTTLTATVTHDAGNGGVNWTVTCATGSCGSVAPVSTASGVPTTYTAPPPPAADLPVTITATSVDDPPARAAAAVTVPAIVVMTQPDSVTVPEKTTTQFTATVSNDLANSGVQWSLSCSPEPCGNVSPVSTASGVPTTYTAPAQLANDLTVTIKASSVADTTKSSHVNATVPAIRVSAISPDSALLPQNTTQAFKATVEYDANNHGVTWSLSQNGAACSPACGTVDPETTQSGAATTYTAPATVPAKTIVTMNAASAANEAKVARTNFTLTNGTVKLVPASLSFECKSADWGGSGDCPPDSQTVALTNSGTSALTINGIAITGSTQFSQTNDCGGSVNPGSSCTITVSFAATLDDVTGTVLIRDSSVDSPQQVALTGITSAMELANTAMARSDLAATTFAHVPAPTGQDTVGTQVLYLKDSALEDPYLANGTKRELAVRVWYPARSSALTCQPAEYASPAVWQYYAKLVGVAPFAVKTNSCWDAPVADGAHPVVVFTPGYTATATDYTFLLEDLASRGYVVVAINHTYEATAVDLGHGRLARSLVGSHLGGPVLRDRWSLASAVSVRLLDVKFVVSEVQSLNALSGSPFAGKLDLARIGVVGHSMGGLTAYLSLESDPRLKAAVMLDGFAPEVLGSSTRKPVLVIAAGRQWRAEDCRLWKNLQGPRLAVNLSGTEHVALSDWIWLDRSAVRVGPMGPERTMDALRDYVAAFLDANLRGDRSASPSLLSGASPAYSGALVTGADQPLCREQ